MIAVLSGNCTAAPAYAAAGVGPQRLSVAIIRTALSGRIGLRMRVPSSACVTCSLCSACAAFTRGTAAPRRRTCARAALASTDLGGFVLARQALASALHRRDELREVDLERVEDLVGVVLRAEADLALARSRVFDDVLRRALGLLGDFLFADQPLLTLARVFDDPLGLFLRLGEHLLALLHDPPRLLDLLGDRRAHLVEDVVDLLLVDPHLVGHHDRLRVVHEVVELVDQYEDVHQIWSVDAARARRSREVFKLKSRNAGSSACELFLQTPRDLL